MQTDAIDAEFVQAPGSALAVRPEAPQSFLDVLRPRDRIAMATEIADAIKDVIVQRGWLKRIGESDHVYVEGWQFVASLAGASCKVTESKPLADGKGWEAHAVVVRIDSGIEIGAGSGMCSRDERTWKSREDYALRAMSETRAMSRALRGVFSFIVELAGYRATPAEEMPDHDTAPLREAGRRSQPTEPQKATAEQHRELQALAKSFGLKIVAVASTLVPGFANRPTQLLNVAEYALVKAHLEALGMPPAGAPTEASKAAPIDDGSKMTPRTQGRLFALLDERLSTEKESRLIFAQEHGIVVDSFSKITELQARTLIRALELLKPLEAAEDPDDLLEMAHDRGLIQ